MSLDRSKSIPSIDAWLKEAKAHPSADKVGMYLSHNGVVRATPRAQVREGINDGTSVVGMEFSYDADKVEAIIEETYKMDGIAYVKMWMATGHLEPGDDIMYVLVGGDIRPNVIDALQYLVHRVKTECVVELEDKK